MKYKDWYERLVRISRWMKRKVSAADDEEREGFGQNMLFGVVLSPGVKLIGAAKDTIAKDGTIYEDGQPVGTIETMDRQTVITDLLTKKKFFIYDDGAVYGDNGHKIGTVAKAGSSDMIRDIYGRNITLHQKALKNLRFVRAS